MLFNSLSFLVFFPVVTLLYFLLPHRFRWALLLSASSFFYMAFVPEYILILFGLILVDYVAGILLERTEGKKRRYILWASILSMGAVLLTFKYFNFVNENIAALADFLHWNYSYEALALILPIGLSFHTFQSLSYVIEVYYGRQKAEYNLGIYAVYVMFYPQLVAGPIERPQHLLPQFREVHSFDAARVGEGLRRMLWGFFKKCVIADSLAPFVDVVFADPHSYGGISLGMASLFFVFQLYCDFSGYSDIALGSAKVMGFTLMENFNRPFVARSIPDFWRRWHISLSSWFRDYFFTPLALSIGRSRAHLYLAVFLTFLATGFWHGANWTFGVFGALHGVYIAFGMATQRWRERFAEMLRLTLVPRFRGFLQILTTFALIVPGLVFFRATNVSEAWYIVSSILSGFRDIPELLASGAWREQFLFLGQGKNAFLLGVFFIALLLLLEFLDRKGALRALLLRQSEPVRWAFYLFAIWVVLNFGVFGARQFIYFVF